MNTGATLMASGASPAGECGLPPQNRSPATYLGLDQDGSRLAWARGAADMQKPEVGTEGLPDWKRPDGVMDWAVPQERVHEFIFDQARNGVAHVVSESLYIGDNINGLMLMQLMTIRAAVAHACLKADVRWTEVRPREWRKRFLGVAGAPAYLKDEERRPWLKAEAQRICTMREWQFDSEHEAEACGVLNYALCRDYPGYEERWLPLFYERRHS